MERVTQSSKQSGGPRVVRRAGEVVVVQSKLIGWILIAIGVGFPALILASEKKFRRDPVGYLSVGLDGLDWGMSIVAIMGALLFVLMTVYGLFWLIWTRHLVIDLNSKRLRFRTGFWPRIKSINASTGEVKTIHLWRKVVRPVKTTVGGDGGGSSGGRYPPWESWEVRLSIPGSGEPLFLGEWGLRREAVEEVERWQTILPQLTLDERDSRPDVGRAPE